MLEFDIPGNMFFFQFAGRMLLNLEMPKIKDPQICSDRVEALSHYITDSLPYKMAQDTKKVVPNTTLHMFISTLPLEIQKKVTELQRSCPNEKDKKTSSNLTAFSATPRNVNMEPENTLRAPWKRRKSSSNQTIIFLQLQAVYLPGGCIFTAPLGSKIPYWPDFWSPGSPSHLKT